MDRDDGQNGPLITGYDVIRFGVPMIGEYVNAGRGTVTISPAVPGAQYRIKAWGLGDGRRSKMPTMENVTTGEARECTCAYIMLLIIRMHMCI